MHLRLTNPSSAPASPAICSISNAPPTGPAIAAAAATTSDGFYDQDCGCVYQSSGHSDDTQICEEASLDSLFPIVSDQEDEGKETTTLFLICMCWRVVQRMAPQQLVPARIQSSHRPESSLADAILMS